MTSKNENVKDAEVGEGPYQKAFNTAFSKLAKLRVSKDMNKEVFSCRAVLNL